MIEPSNEFEKKEAKGAGEPADTGRRDIVDTGITTDGPGTSASRPEETTPNSPEELLAQLRAEVEKYKDAALRATADLDNYRKRVAREREEAIKYANASFLERLIPILDNFELGLQAARGTGHSSAILDGMNMVYKQLQDFLTSFGVEAIDATGKTFDPNLHEAIAHEEHNEIPEDQIIRQVRKGYRLRDRLLRPANVVVSKGAPHPVAAGREGNK
jgi:molecular chaperone GrpE